MDTSDAYADQAESCVVSASQAEDAATKDRWLREAQVWATLAAAAATLDASVTR